MKLRVEKFFKFELKAGVMVLCGLIIVTNIGIVIYGERHTFERTDSRFLQIVFNFGELELDDPIICVHSKF